jgi:23S rRNA pseudouridine1911/1915/1917 synthase
VHLAHIGHPLLGDPAYGPRSARALARFGPHAGEAAAAIAGFPRQALHARLLGFTHPVTGMTLTFESLLPVDMAGLLANLERL